MSQKPKYWVLSLLLGLVLWLGLPLPSWAANPAASADAKVLHVLNRLSFGPRPGDLERVKATGIEAYIQSQLNPNSIPEPPALTQQLNRLTTLKLTPAELRKQYWLQPQGKLGANPTLAERQQAFKQSFIALRQALESRQMRAINSPRQLQEVMVDFWYNHFNVYAEEVLSLVWVGAYEEQAIRPHVFSKFRQLLEATAKHPAMVYYLDNWRNTAPNSPGVRDGFQGLNENYARELLELHTLGVDGGYTQQDITALARIFTGWGLERIDRPQANPGDGFYFDETRHDFGDKVFLGQTIKGRGIAEVEQALDILTRHPATARHISYKLAQYFVADQPPPSLVNQLSQRFQATDGDIRAVLDTLFHSPEFNNPQYYNAKFKTPYQYVLSAARAISTKFEEPRHAGLMQQLGMAPYNCLSPDGYKNTEAAWLNPDAMLRRITIAIRFANGLFEQDQPVDPQQLSKTLGNTFSAKTKKVIESSPPQLRAALMLGSPEFMQR